MTVVEKKTLRYYYWLVTEFAKKNIKLILLSFAGSFIFVVSLISLSPYIETVFLTKKDSIGIIGRYDYNNLPEEVANKISNGLVFINGKGEIIPTLSSSWEVLDNGKQYRFHLKNNLIWSDGRPFSAKDITYQFKDVVVEAKDDNTISFKFQKPLPIFPTYLVKPVLRFPLIGVGGLYKVDRVKSQYGYVKELYLSPNKKDLPIVEYKFYDNETQLINAYKKGEINQLTTSKKTVADIFVKWKNTKVEKFVDYSKLLTLFFNLKNPILNEKEVRQAILMAIDPDLFEEFGEMAIGPIPPVSWAYTQDLKSSVYQPDTAEKIISKATEASQSSKLKIATYYDYLDVNEQIVGHLKEAGLEVETDIISYANPNQFDMLLAFWKVPQDPDQYYFWHSTQKQGNVSNFNNVKVDKLLEDGRNTIHIDERKNVYREFQKVMLDDPPAGFLYYPYVYTIKRR
jgi:peptide/nickel transport system substrate-binding protein